MATGLTPTYLIPYPLSTDPVNVHTDMRLLALQLEDVMYLKPDKNLPNILTKTNTYTISGTDNGIIINQSGTGVPLRITNTGTGNSFLVEDSASTDTTPFVIDASGNVGIGKTVPTVLLDVAGIGAFSGALTASTFNALTLTSATTGFTIAGGTTSKTLTVSNTLALAGTDATTMTFPSTNQTLAGLSVVGQTFTSGQTFRAVNAIRSEAAAGQDAMLISGRAGGTGSFALTLTPTSLTSNKTVTFQDVTGTAYVSTGTDVTLADGGTNASLTASNGGIVYSTASAMAILAGTATAGQMLRSGATGAPSWSTATFPSTATTAGQILRADGTNWVATTATYPTTTTANQILYSSALNTISEITTANNQVLVTGATGIPAFSATLPSGVTASSLISFGTSPTLTTPTIDTINGSTATAAISLYPTSTSATITLGTLIGSTAATGTINIANNAGIAGGTKAINIGTGATAGTTTITVGSTTGTSTTFNGTINLPTSTTKVGQTFLLQGGAVNITFPTLAGTLVGTGDSGSISTAMLANSSSTTTGVTYAKMQYVSTQYNMLGRITTASGVVEELTPNNIVTVLAQATTRTGGTTNIVFDSSPTITTPVIDSISGASASANGSLWSNVQVGTLNIGTGLTTGPLNIATGTAFAGTLSIATGAGTVNKTINIGTSSTAGTTAITLGSSSGATSTILLNGGVTTTGNLTVGGDLAVNGTLTTVNSNTVTVDDKNLELGSVVAGTVSTTGTIGTVSGAGPFTATITNMTSTTGIVPGSIITATAGTGSFGAGTMSVVSIVSNTSITVSSTATFTAGTVTNILGQAATDATANGGGITLKGATDKSIIWDLPNNNWTSSENWNILTGKTFKINNVSVLSSTVVLGLTPTINATGYTLSGGTTPVAVTFAGGSAYTISGTNGQTYTMPSAGGTLIANPMTTLGDIIYGGASGAPTRLAGNATNGIYFLRENVTASASVAPDWIGSTGTGNVVLATSPSIAGGTHTALTSLSIRDTSAAFDVTLAATSSTALTAARSLTLDLINASRTVKLNGNIDLGGNLTTASSLTTSGAFALTLTATNTTNATIPAGTVTLVDLATSQALTNKTISGLTVSTTTGTLTIPAATITHAGAFATTITATAITNATLPAGTTTLAANVTTTIGDTIYASATGTPGTLARLAGNTTTTRTFLGQTGDGTNSAAPSWTSSTGTGNVVLATSPSLTTPTLGVATATSINKVAFTAPATSATLTIADGKTLTVNNSITLSAANDTSTLNISTGGTLGTAAFTASSAYEPAITTLAISKGGTGTGTAPTQWGVIYAASTTAYASTAAGTNTQVLIGNATGAPSWTNISGLSVSSATTATNLSGTTLYSIPYQSASGTTSYTAIGTAGQVLAVNGTTNGYTWVSPFTNPMTTLGDLVYGGASGVSTRLAGSATNGQYFLTENVTASTSVAPTWQASTGTAGSNVVLATSPTITTPKIDSINTVAGAAATPTLWSDVTTGSIAIGAGITTGTVNIATAGTGVNAINIGNTNSTLTVNGNLTVNGTTTTVNSVTITVDDPNLELNSVASPSDANANGGGITLKGTTDKSIIWDTTNTNWTANQHFNIPTGKVYKINNTEVLSSTAVLGITPTINATGFALAGGTTSKTLTVQNTLTLAGTDSSTLNIGTGGTLGTAAFTASSAYEPAITTLAVSKGGTGTGTAPTQYGVIYASSATAYASTAAGNNTQVLIGNAAGAPSWSNISGLSVLSATKLTTARNINGVPFDGSADITISSAAAAGTLTGSTLASNVTTSSLTSVGTLSSLVVSGNLTVSGVVTVPTPTNNTDAANKAYVDSVLNAGVPEIVPLDDIRGQFNGIDSRFVPTYQGIAQSITNPLRLMLSINGIIQYVDFPDYVWQSPLPREGFQIDNDGYIAFSEVVPAGSSFDARIMPGPNTITKKRQYPFKAVDILLGG